MEPKPLLLSDRKSSLTASLLIVLSSVFIQFKYMNEFPVYYHAWAQDDHYALALGFIDNGFDLLHPQTYIYNKQFPDWWERASNNTITAVDFPIHEYVVAFLMKATGSTSPWVFRCWTLICSILGLLFLYDTAFQITASRIKSLLATLFAMCSPVFAFYFNGFLPGTPAFAFGTIGLWYYIKHLKTNQIKHFIWCIAFLTLSTLIRTTFAIELIAMLCFEFLRFIRKESEIKGKIYPVLVSVCAISAYLLWNSHLRSNYGSLFLNKLMPPESFDDAKEILKDAKDTWEYHYFQKMQYIVFLIVTVLSCVFGLQGEVRKQKSTEKPSTHLSLCWLPIIYLFGCLLFTIAMMQQIPQHDYYFIDTFLLPIILVLTLLLKPIPTPEKSWAKVAVGLAVACLCAMMLVGTWQKQQERRSGYDMASICFDNFKDSDRFLDSIGIPREAKIVALFAYPQNGPFIQMGRKGYSVMWDKPSLIQAIDTWDFDFIVIEDYMFGMNYEERKEILDRLDRIADNGRISVCTMSDKRIPLTNSLNQMY